MTIIDGKKLAQKVLAGLQKKINSTPLHLAAVIVGDDPGIEKFVRVKKRYAESVGITFSLYAFNQSTSPREIIGTIEFLNQDSGVQGIFVELPVCKPHVQNLIINAINPAKDVDVLTDVFQKKFYAGETTILPPAVRALELVLQEYNFQVDGKKIAVFGQGFLVGKPVSYWLKQKGGEVLVIDELTLEPEKFSHQADMIISAVGKPGVITGDMLKDQAVVIDYGYRIVEGNVFGDVQFETVAPKASFITPVPGGMGPLVVAAVLENLWILKGEF